MDMCLFSFTLTNYARQLLSQISLDDLHILDHWQVSFAVKTLKLMIQSYKTNVPSV